MLLRNRSELLLLLLFSNSPIFGAQQPGQSDFHLDAGAGRFNILTTDLNCLIAAQLPPRDKDVLRVTCKALSTFLSFCNASRFVLYENFCAAKKDISSIFTVAAFDKNYRLVEGLCNKYNPDDHNYGCIESKCRFTQISPTKFMCLDRKHELVISPYAIGCNNNDTEMMLLLEKYRLPSTEISSTNTTRPNGKEFNLLIACISRNTERIIQATKDIIHINLSDIGYSLATIIDNDDSQSLAAIIHEKRIKKCIKKNGTNFLDLAIFGRHSKTTQILIASGYFDFNNITKEIFDGGNLRIYSGTYLDFLDCCKEHCQINQSAFLLLEKNGAKRSEDEGVGTFIESIASSIRDAWDDFTWGSLLNSQK